MARAVEAAYDMLRAGILSGEFERGSHLREEQLAMRAGVSRTPVREALKLLDAEGLVEFVPNRGARVAGWTRRQLEDLYEIRAMMEGFAARLAATRIRPEQIEALARVAERMEEVTRREPLDVAAVTTLNGEFHGLIVKASNNAQLDQIIRSVTDVPLVYQTFSHYSPERLRVSNMHHRELVDALAAGNGAWAESVMRAHILGAGTTVMRAAGPATWEDDDQ